MERQLRWWRCSEEEPELHYWNFLIVNEDREIRDIRQKLRVALTPIEPLYKVSFSRVVSEKVLDEGSVQGSSGLKYQLAEIVSTKGSIDFSKVYQGRVIQDRQLRPRMTRDGWNEFIEKVYRGNL